MKLVKFRLFSRQPVRFYKMAMMRPSLIMYNFVQEDAVSGRDSSEKNSVLHDRTNIVYCSTTNHCGLLNDLGQGQRAKVELNWEGFR